MQDAIWDNTSNNPEVTSNSKVVSSSFGADLQAAPGSPFYNAYSQLTIDAALQNITLITAAGDGGSQSQYGTGYPLPYQVTSSEYELPVGGSSIATMTAAS